MAHHTKKWRNPALCSRPIAATEPEQLPRSLRRLRNTHCCFQGVGDASTSVPPLDSASRLERSDGREHRFLQSDITHGCIAVKRFLLCRRALWQSSSCTIVLGLGCFAYQASVSLSPCHPRGRTFAGLRRNQDRAFLRLQIFKLTGLVQSANYPVRFT